MTIARSPFLCTSALTLAALLAGCGSAPTPGVNASIHPSSSASSAAVSAAGSRNNSFVYVSTPSIAGGAGNYIQGWSVAADGALTAVPGSPVDTPSQISVIVADGRYLFGDLNASGADSIGAWRIAPNGSLSLATSTPAEAFNSSLYTYNSGTTTDFTDRAGVTLYDHGNAYAIKPNGSLTWLSDIVDNAASTPGYVEDEIAFTPNDRLGYTSDCTFGDQNLYGFARASSGALTYFNPNANVPTLTPNPEGTSYCPTYAAAIAAPDNQHVVFSLQVGTDPGSYTGVNQLAVYTIGSSGALSTTNTSATMPATSVGQATDYKFDPSGRWLAIAGSSGLEIFRYNNGVLSGGTTLISNDGPSQIAWDSAGHLFAIGQDSGNLYVFDVNQATGAATPAPGSPTTVPLYSYLAVQPLP